MKLRGLLYQRRIGRAGFDYFRHVHDMRKMDQRFDGTMVESSEKMGYNLMDKTLEGAGLLLWLRALQGGWVAAS
ncbi:MAG: hypothetical protein R3C56_17785 [Pirellulaceae bacterium]